MQSTLLIMKVVIQFYPASFYFVSINVTLPIGTGSHRRSLESSAAPLWERHRVTEARDFSVIWFCVPLRNRGANFGALNFCEFGRCYWLAMRNLLRPHS